MTTLPVLLSFAAFAAAAMTLYSHEEPAETSKERKFVVGYAPNWVDLKAFSESIPYERLTHLNIAFENPTDDTGTMSFKPENDLLIKKARENGVKVLMSIGGGSAAEDPVLKPRYFKLISKENRAGFAKKLADYVVQHNLDGLDVDIEGPSINEDYGAFIEELAKTLKPKGKLLTSALSVGYGGDRVPGSALKAFDFVNIMAYDGTGPWGKDRPGHHSTLEMAKANVAFFTGRGLEKSKAVLGVPFYGYGFGDAYRSYGYPYSELVAKYPEATEKDEVGKTIWHTSLPSMREKCRYVVDEGLAGIMIWSIDQDTADDKSLLKAIHETLNP